MTKLFEKTAKALSVNTAIVIFLNPFGWFAAGYGYFFIQSIFAKELGGFKAFQIALLSSILFVTFISYFWTGVFTKWGYLGLGRRIRLSNRILFQKDLSGEDDAALMDLYSSVCDLPKDYVLTSLRDALFCIAVSEAAHWFSGGTMYEVLVIAIGGLFATLILNYMSYILVESLLARSKIAILQEFDKRSLQYEYKSLISFRSKFFAITLLFLFSIFILILYSYLNTERNIVHFVTFFILNFFSTSLLMRMYFRSIMRTLNYINLACTDLAQGGKGRVYIGTHDQEFVDFTKNFNQASEVVYRIRNNLETEVRARTAQLDRTLQTIRKDLAIASKLQKNTLPTNLGKIPQLSVFAEYIPMAEVGGDIYSIDELRPGFVRVFIADATGHGMQAALVTMCILSEYQHIKEYQLQPAALLEALNSQFCHHYSFLNSYFTCSLMDIDMNGNKITFSSAGHPTQVLLRDGNISLLPKTGPLIGVKDKAEYELIEMKFQKEDKIFLFSDGIFEEFDSNNEEFGEERLHNLIREYGKDPVNSAMEKILQRVDEFLDHKGRQDDITFLAFAHL